jgi:ribosomal protein S18 acetylase RimI-like enzyme
VVGLSRPELAAAAAANLAGWHASCTRSLGLRSTTTAWRWVAHDPVPVIFFSAVTLGSPPEGPDLGRLAAELANRLDRLPGWLAVSDPWNRLDLSSRGLQRDEPQTWMVRQPGPIPPPRPSASDVDIVKVADELDLAEFEAVGTEGFGTRPAPPRTYYGPGVLDAPEVRTLLARASDGTGVGTAMAHVGDDVVGIYSVSVLPAFRGRGIAWALTREAIATAPDRPAVLQPSNEAASMYRRMGFEPFDRFAVWVRPER